MRKVQKNKMCKNEFKDNNHFGSRNSTFEIWALEIPESRMSSKRHSDTLCVKAHNLWEYFNYNRIEFSIIT